MDALDLRLLRLMYPSVSGAGGVAPGVVRPADLAARVGVLPETVRERLQRLERLGVLERFDARPNPRLFGLHWSAHLVDLGGARPDALDVLEGVDGVGGWLDFVGDRALVVLLHADDAEKARRLALVEKLVGARPRVEVARPPYPQPPRALTPLDWRIVQALRPDGRRPASDVARAVGVTARTVRDRLDRMLRETSLMLLPVIERGRLEGVFAHLVCHPSSEEPASDLFARVLEATDAHRVYAWPPRGAFAFDIGVHAASVAEVEDARRRLDALPGIARVEALIPRRGYDNIEWLDALIATRANAGG